MASLDSAHTWKIEIGSTPDDFTSDTLRNVRMTEGDAGLTTTFQCDIYDSSRDIDAWEEIKWISDPGLGSELTLFGGYVINAQPEKGRGEVVWHIKAEGYVSRAQRTQLLRKAYVDRTIAYIVDDLFTTAGLVDFDSTTYVDTGATLDLFNTNGEKLSTALNRLLEIAAQKASTPWSWRIDSSKNVIFGAASSNTAAFNVSDSANANYTTVFPAEEKSAIKKIDTSDIRNRITVRGGTQASSTQTEQFNGDTSTTVFQLTHKPIRAIVQISVGGTIQDHGTDWLHNPASYDCLTNYSAGTVTWAVAPGSGTNNVEVQYTYDEAVIATESDAASYAQYGFYFDYEIQDGSISNELDATDLANSVLEQYAFGVTHGSFDVKRIGLHAGEQINIRFDDLDINGDYPISRVTYEVDKSSVYAVCTVTWGGRPVSFSSTFGGGASGTGGSYYQTTTPRIVAEADNIWLRDALYVGSSVTGYDSGTGVFLGFDSGVPKMHIGDPSNDFLKWDGTDLIITGKFIGASDITGTDSISFTINEDLNTATSSLVFGASGGSATINWDGSDLQVENPVIIDVTDAEAFLVRQNADGGDVLSVNTTDSNVVVTGDMDISPQWTGDDGPTLNALHINHALTGSDGASGLAVTSLKITNSWTSNDDIADWYGIQVVSSVEEGSGTATTHYGMDIEATFGGTVYGLHAITSDADGTDYAIYAQGDTYSIYSAGSGAQNYFEGSLEVDGVTTLNGDIGSDLIPDTTDTHDLGSATKLWHQGFLSEINAVLFAKETVSVTGGWWMVPHASGTLGEDVDGTETAIDFGTDYGGLAVDDFVLMRGISAAGTPQVEYMQITSSGGGQIWNVTRNVDASGANTWTQGHVWVNLGYNGDGRIEFDAQTGGPRISVFRQGTSYNAQTEYVRIGDLDDSYGYSSETYGVGIGAYGVGNYLTVDAADGLQFYNSSHTQLAQLSGSTWTLGDTSSEHVKITGTGVQIKDGSTVYTDLTAGVLKLGDTTAGTDYINISSTAISMYGNSVETIKLSSDGSGWLAGDGKLNWDTSGNIDMTGSITITGGSGIENLDNTEWFLTQLLNPQVWQLGEMPPTGWTEYGVGYSDMIQEIGPWGDRRLIWEATSDGSGSSQGGIASTNTFAVDPTKTYRFIVFVNRQNNLTDGSIYLGPPTGGTYVEDIDDGGANANPYFWYGDVEELDHWYMIVGYIHPHDTPTTSTYYGGLFDVETGERVSVAFLEFRWADDTITSCYARTFCWGQTTSGTITYFTAPRVDVINGSEPSIQALIGRNVPLTNSGEAIATSAPSGAGLYIDSTHMGYYSGSAWQTYMDNSGLFYLTGADASTYLQWTPSTSTLTAAGWTLSPSAITVTIDEVGEATDNVVTLSSAGYLEFEDWEDSAYKLHIGIDDGSYLIYYGSTPASSKFKLSKWGNLTCTNATVSGTVTATEGEIGGFTISSSALTSGDFVLDSLNGYVVFNTGLYFRDGGGFIRCTGDLDIGGGSDLTMNTGSVFDIQSGNFKVTAATGNTVIAGTLDVAGDFDIGSGDFTVAAASGNTVIGGTLDVQGGGIFRTGGALILGDDIQITGAIDAQSTLNINGAISNDAGDVSIDDTLDLSGNFYIATNKFQVFYSSGNVFSAGTIDAVGGFSDNGTAGIDSSWTVAVGDVVTVAGGIITAIV